ncbi:MAG TPA: aspartate--ammonia ligase [Bacteroidales bacterium]|nr:aspartate--ammonia ligase [Bacteroidales bacterium]HPI68887.1 aspartate--ammonia ligase [Bacteroidales bacterium]HPR73423.1 aspartate--ammonia ligase [Bacteroidales bacterium]
MTFQAETIHISCATDMLKTEEMIDFIKTRYEKTLAGLLDIVKVSAPVVVPDGTGINDDLNGEEEPIRFPISSLNGQKASIIQSLAKWKRMRLRYYHIPPGKGILTDMRALRPGEKLSPIHSVYVDQWDWEKSILPEQRNLKLLKSTVEIIYKSIRLIEDELFERYSWITPQLPPFITFIHAEELCRMYPELTPKQREYEASKKFKAVFIIGIGNELTDGKPHDQRAPDYDDWSTLNEEGFYGLNGDILFWNPVLNSAFEISSMGIRVDPRSMERQLEISGCQDRKNLLFHKLLLDGQLPLSIGGGIGQSRLCMFLLKKLHIGEVQSSVWPTEVMKKYKGKDVKLL